MTDTTQNWASAARRVDVEDETGTPAVLDDGIPAGEFFQERSREVAVIEGSIETTGPTSSKPRPKSRTLTRAEREAQEADASRLKLEAERSRIDTERQLEAERKRFREIDPLRAASFWTALVVGIVIFITSGLFSYAALAAAAEWMRPEWPWLTYVVPGFVELFIIFFGIEGIINQARAVYARSGAEKAYYSRQSKTSTWWMVLFASVAVAGNAAHTIAEWLATGEIPWFGFVGIVMSALAPLSVVLITKRLSRLVFIYAVEE